MHKYHTELSSIVASIESLVTDAQTLPPEMAIVQQRIISKMNIERNFINSLLGVQSGNNAGPTVLPPLTSIMGEAIVFREPVTVEALQPSNDEATKFLSERDTLYSKFINTPDNDLWNKTRQPMGESVIRACAKKAGLEDYATAKVNKVFFDRVRKAIDAEDKLATALNEADANVNAAG